MVSHTRELWSPRPGRRRRSFNAHGIPATTTLDILLLFPIGVSMTASKVPAEIGGHFGRHVTREKWRSGTPIGVHNDSYGDGGPLSVLLIGLTAI